MVKDGIMLSCRVPREDVACIDALARDAGCTRSEYIRRVLKLPVAMQIETVASLRMRCGGGDEAAGCKDRETIVRDTFEGVADYTLGVTDSCRTGYGSVLCLTDVPIRKLCVAIDRWGTNYNQAVRALNALVKRLQGVSELDDEDVQEIIYLLQVCARGNENAKAGIDSVAEEVRSLLGVAHLDMRQKRNSRRRDDGAASDSEGAGLNRGGR